jgi:hypothetical protein
MMPISPTSLKLFVECPALYKATYISKSYKAPSSPALERGNIIHDLLAKAVSHPGADWPEEELHVWEVAEPIVKKIQQMKEMGWNIQVEYSAALNSIGEPCDFWDSDAFLRCRLDVLAVSPKQDSILIFDWKTGRTKADSDIQLAINCLCVSPLYTQSAFDVFFIYLDQKNWTRTHYEVDTKVCKDMSRDDVYASSMWKTLLYIKQLTDASDLDIFDFNYGTHCRWCRWKGCEN